MARTLKIILTALALSLGVADSCLAEVPALNQPAWEQLTPEQRSILQPLAGEWPAMESYRRKKWLGIAQRYSTMSPDEKVRVDQRMREWAKLTPEQRQQARANYKSLKQVPPEQKEDVKRKWEEYSQLPAEEREQHKAEAARKPPTKAPPLVQPVRPLQQSTAVAPLVPLSASPRPNSDGGVVPAPTGVLSPMPPAVKQNTAEKP
ncbi:MAG: DUF3106 domain-containing protein [Rhodocyclaceae bacterium]|nr:DUF3106 domain-containing protein [Rhodocyclaceae bacterium]MBP7079522.1 DUF3106 domain-containing protein [Rhodocyclaceae bacterium]